MQSEEAGKMPQCLKEGACPQTPQPEFYPQKRRRGEENQFSKAVSSDLYPCIVACTHGLAPDYIHKCHVKIVVCFQYAG